MLLGPYRRVLSVPGGAAFSAAGFVARLPISMQTLGTVLLVAATSGSYALDRKSTRLNSSHLTQSRMPSSA